MIDITNLVKKINEYELHTPKVADPEYNKKLNAVYNYGNTVLKLHSLTARTFPHIQKSKRK